MPPEEPNNPISLKIVENGVVAEYPPTFAFDNEDIATLFMSAGFCR